MYGGEKTLYPMLGVGAFFAMFWVGFVLAFELNWACDSMLINGLLFGGLGSYFVVRLEGHDSRRHRPPPNHVSAVESDVRKARAIHKTISLGSQ